jgi:hypothetical protein
VQPETVPTAFLAKLAAVAATLGLAALAWFQVVKPEIRDAAQDRVDERLTDFDQRIEQLNEATGEDPTASTLVDSASPSTDDGEPREIRLELRPAKDETIDATAYTVPDGEIFDLSDIRIENSNNDLGRATLLVNGEVRYTWSLANIRGSVFEPSLTPTRLAAGDNVTVSVFCNTVGDSGLGTCLVAANLGGRAITSS